LSLPVKFQIEVPAVINKPSRHSASHSHCHCDCHSDSDCWCHWQSQKWNYLFL